jgi:hypothetical protein
MLIPVALWQYDQAQHPDVRSALTPPRALLHDDGTVKTFAELGDAERDAYEAWLARPVPESLRVPGDGPQPRTLEELMLEIDDEFAANFQKLLIKP